MDTELATGMPTDAPSTTVEVTAAVDRDRLWSLLVDPAHPVGSSAELRDAEWLDDGPALGARFIGHNRRGDRSWTTTSTVTSFDPGRCLAWTVEALDDPVSSWTYELDATEEGVTTVRYTCRLGPGPSGLTAAYAAYPDKVDEITERRLASLHDSMQATVEAIVAAADPTQDR